MSDQKATVVCRAPSGLVLRLHEMQDVGLGIKQSRPTGATLTLRSGTNEGVDAAFIRAWLAQNPDQVNLIAVVNS